MPWDYRIALDSWASIQRLDADVQENLLDLVEGLGDSIENLMLDGRVDHEVFPLGHRGPVTLDLLVRRDHRYFTVLDVEI